MGGSVFSGRVIFDHLPKTGGQAVNAWLREEMGSGCVTPNVDGEHAQLIRRWGGQYCIISAHVEFDGLGLDPRYQYLTCIREPVDRLLSWLHFLAGHGADEIDPALRSAVLRFIQTNGQENNPILAPHLDNPLVRHFAAVGGRGVRNASVMLEEARASILGYAVVGIYEEFDRFLSGVADHLGLRRPSGIPRVNETVGRPRVREEPPELVERLRALCALDLELYSWLRGQRTLRVSEVSSDRPVLEWQKYPERCDRVFEGGGFRLLGFSSSANFGSVQSGELIAFELDYSLAEPLGGLEVGIHILDADSRWAFGTNTTMLGTDMPSALPGRYHGEFAVVADLPEGAYTVGFAFGERSVAGFQELAWFDRLSAFRVRARRVVPSIGYCGVGARFSARRTGDPERVSIVDGAGSVSLSGELGWASCGEILSLPVVVENSSNGVWLFPQLHRLTLQCTWTDEQGAVRGEVSRHQLEVSEIWPGAVTASTVRVPAPVGPGRHWLTIEALQEPDQLLESVGCRPCKLLVEVVPVATTWRFSGSDFRIRCGAGVRSDGRLRSAGKAGFLAYGPYLAVPAGRYHVGVAGIVRSGGATAHIEVVHSSARAVVLRKSLVDGASGGLLLEADIDLEVEASDLEVRLWVSAESEVELEGVLIRREDDAAVDAATTETLSADAATQSGAIAREQ